MSKNRNRAKLNKALNNRQSRILWINHIYPPYWDEGRYLYPRYRRGFVNPNRSIFPAQVRMYRTWKHNRKTQYKICKK